MAPGAVLPHPIGELTRRTTPRTPDGLGPVTSALTGRLNGSDRHAIASRVDGELAALERERHPAARLRLQVPMAVHFELGEAIDHAGVAPARPSGDALRGPVAEVAAIGDGLGADVLAESLDGIGHELGAGDRVLEVGCQWGQRLRLLAAWRGDVSWSGVDLGAAGAAWASGQLTSARVRVSPSLAALPADLGRAEAAFSLTACAALPAANTVRLFGDLARVLGRGMPLVIALPGLTRLADDLEHGRLDGPAAGYALRSLYRTGHARTSVLDGAGERSYLTLEWLMTFLGGAWGVIGFTPARMVDGEDVVVLRRA